jgi:branched-chain amino acid transport system permease protein
VARTFQHLRLFGQLSVQENVLVALDRTRSWWSWRYVGWPFGVWGYERSLRLRASELLASFGLSQFAGARPGALPYGIQRRLELARAMAAAPRLLLLDEPAAGMNTEETARLIADIRASRGLVEGLLLIEHDMSLIAELADRVIAMENGAKIAEGRPRDVLADPWVREAYLGLE